jgi:hypothetical protein
MPRELAHNLVYRTAASELSIAADGAITIADRGRHREGKLTDAQMDELLALLDLWDQIRLRFWLFRAWTVDESDVSITWGRRTIYGRDLLGRNSAFWRIEHFLNHLMAGLPLVDSSR